jgi:hypothetical protein
MVTERERQGKTRKLQESKSRRTPETATSPTTENQKKKSKLMPLLRDG